MARFRSLFRKWWFWLLAVAIVMCGVAFSQRELIGALVGSMQHPAKPFETTPVPPAPNYAQSRAWLAFPGRNGLERSTPPGFTPVDEAKARADVFFIHPTTYNKRDVWNVAYDAPAKLNSPVLIDQISIFNGCCRLYAPRFRQAAGPGLGIPKAMEYAYGDVLRAFRYYMAHENHGRPFIIVGHSQGAFYAFRLLSDEIAPTALKKQLVAAYVIGAYVPSNTAELGLPVCHSARETGCIISWNTAQVDWTKPREVLTAKTGNYWWKGALHKITGVPMLCVNPLNWTTDKAAPASANPGSLDFPEPPFSSKATTLPPLWQHLTGAYCKDELLYVDVPDKAPNGYHDLMARWYGSYHVNDLGMFYGAIRQNAIDRAEVFTAEHPQNTH